MNKELYSQLFDASRFLFEVKEIDEEIQEKRTEIKRWSDEKNNKKKNLDDLQKKIKDKQSGCFTALIIAITMLALFPVGVIVMFVLIGKNSEAKEAEKQYPDEKELYDSFCLEAEKVCKKLKDEINVLTEEKNQYITKNSHIMEFLPKSYHNVYAVSFMLVAIKNCRADTLKEVINLYEDELHHLELKNELENASRIQKMNAEYVEAALYEISAYQQNINDNVEDIQRRQYIESLRK